MSSKDRPIHYGAQPGYRRGMRSASRESGVNLDSKIKQFLVGYIMRDSGTVRDNFAQFVDEHQISNPEDLEVFKAKVDGFLEEKGMSWDG